MDEDERHLEDPELNQPTNCIKMSLEKRFYFWFKYAAVAFLGAFSIPPLFYLVVKAAILGRLGWFVHQQVFLFLVLQAMFIGLLIAFLVRRLIRRKRKTGSYQPTGEALEARRRRKRLFEKVLVVAFFYFLAIGFTVGALQAHHYRVSVCAFIVVIWLIAICFTVLALLPSKPSRLDDVVAGLLCLAGIFSAYQAITIQHDRGHWLFFSALMWGVAAICMMDRIRSIVSKLKNSVARKESQTMPRS